MFSSETVRNYFLRAAKILCLKGKKVPGIVILSILPADFFEILWNSLNVALTKEKKRTDGMTDTLTERLTYMYCQVDWRTGQKHTPPTTLFPEGVISLLIKGANYPLYFCTLLAIRMKIDFR